MSKKIFITTKGHLEWSDELQQYIAVSDEGYEYDGPLALAGGDPTREVGDWAFYTDGVEDANNIIGSANQDPTLTTDIIYQHRLVLQETAGNTWSDLDIQLEYSYDGGAWTDVNATSSVVRSAPTSLLTEGGDVTAILTGAGAFEDYAGQDKTDGYTTDGSRLGNEYTNAVYAFTIRSADVEDAKIIQLRVWDNVNNDALDVQADYANITVDLVILNQTITDTPFISATSSTFLPEFTGTLTITDVSFISATSQTFIPDVDIVFVIPLGFISSTAVVHDITTTETLTIPDVPFISPLSEAFLLGVTSIYTIDGDFISTGFIVYATEVTSPSVTINDLSFISPTSQTYLPAVDTFYKVQLIIGNIAVPTGPDIVIHDIIENDLGRVVTYISDEATPDVTGFHAVVIVESSSSTFIGTGYKNVTIPVAVFEQGSWDDMDMSTVTGTQVPTPRTFDVLDEDISSLPASGNPYTASTTGYHHKIALTNLGPGVDVISYEESSESDVYSFKYDKDALGVYSFTQPAKRVGWCAENIFIDAFTADGKTHIIDILAWAFAPDNTQQINNGFISPTTQMFEPGLLIYTSIYTPIPDARFEMPSLFIPNRKPVGSIVVDRSHPLAKGLVAGTLFEKEQHHDIISGVRTVTTGTDLNENVKHGIKGLEFTNVNTYQTLLDGRKMSTGGHTIFMVSSFSDSTTRNSAAWGVAKVLNTERCQAHMPWTGGVIYFDYGGTEDGVSRLNYSHGKVANKKETYVFRAGKMGMSIWIDGVEEASHSAPATRTNDPTVDFLLNRAIDTGDLWTVFAFYIWEGELSDEEIRSVTRNPYQFLMPE